jgi:predicted CXXCH cytochrome family protein
VPALQREPLGRERPCYQLIEHFSHPLEDGLAGRIKGEIAPLAGILAQVEQQFALEISLADLEYSIERRDGRVLHQETRRDASGRIIARNEAEVQFVLGSGSQGIGYLIERDGFVFQSPISWYVQKQKWDLAPGYAQMNVHFDRPVASTCLYCHANRVEPVAGTINRYRPPIFQGPAIGCERSHGPGELHVQGPSVADGRDSTIVNPAGLESALRDAVCEQCHLLGHQRVLKAGRREEDYRPGLRFDEFWSVFEPNAGTAEDRFVGQVEQMHESRCFRASQGGLGCISCHDPHQRPEPETQARYYRERCLECHADRGCNLPSEVRLARSPTDDCTGCHMPRADRTDIIHAVVTNHHILRKPDSGDSSPIAPVNPRPGERPLALFHRERMNERQRHEAERDLGVALCRDGPTGAAINCATVARGGAGGAAGRPGRLRGQGVRAGSARPVRGGAGHVPIGPGPGARPGVRVDRSGERRRPGRATR